MKERKRVRDLEGDRGGTGSVCSVTVTLYTRPVGGELWKLISCGTPSEEGFGCVERELSFDRPRLLSTQMIKRTHMA